MIEFDNGTNQDGTEEKDGNKTNHKQGKDKRKGKGVIT